MTPARSKLFIICGLAVCAAAIFAAIRFQPGPGRDEVALEQKGISPAAGEVVQRSDGTAPANLGRTGPSVPFAPPEMPPVGNSRFAPAGRKPPGPGESAPATTASNPAQPASPTINSSVNTLSPSFSPATSLSSSPSGGGTSSNPGSQQEAQGSTGSSDVATVPSSGAGSVESNIPVPVGAIVPAILYDTEPKTPQQQAAVEKVIAEFEKNIAEVPGGYTQTEVWEAARNIADERYITLFGFEKFNQMHLSAAKEALKERKATTP